MRKAVGIPNGFSYFTAMEKPTNLTEMLPHIRRRPGMYLREASITRLEILIYGYTSCLQVRQVEAEGEPDFYAFYEYVRATYGVADNAGGWAELIRIRCGYDEGTSLEEFFRMFELFTSSTPL
jgi:hypothetical protein